MINLLIGVLNSTFETSQIVEKTTTVTVYNGQFQNINYFKNITVEQPRKIQSFYFC